MLSGMKSISRRFERFIGWLPGDGFMKHSASRLSMGEPKDTVWPRMRLRMEKANDLTGKLFGKLTVLYKSTEKAKSGSMWVCKCDCGNTVAIARCSLVSNHSKSCGCTRKEFLSKYPPSKKHGGESIKAKNRRERLYMVWCAMKERCSNPNNNRYRHYGGRGIVVCEEWKSNYATFREWAMQNGYNPSAGRGECTIDRINPDGNYEPGNCRWVDMKTQANNKRKCKK